jgi:hypothetical protein
MLRNSRRRKEEVIKEVVGLISWFPCAEVLTWYFVGVFSRLSLRFQGGLCVIVSSSSLLGHQEGGCGELSTLEGSQAIISVNMIYSKECIPHIKDKGNREGIINTYISPLSPQPNSQKGARIVSGS